METQTNDEIHIKVYLDHFDERVGMKKCKFMFYDGKSVERKNAGD